MTEYDGTNIFWIIMHFTRIRQCNTHNWWSLAPILLSFRDFFLIGNGKKEFPILFWIQMWLQFGKMWFGILSWSRASEREAWFTSPKFFGLPQHHLVAKFKYQSMLLTLEITVSTFSKKRRSYRYVEVKDDAAIAEKQ